MAEFTLERSTVIKAPASAVYPLIADFYQWTTWSPWEDLDPNVQRSYTGPESGLGATYGWTGNRKAGEGRMEILEATEPSELVIDLQFFKPFKAHNTTTFTLSQSGGSTTVRWAMRGPQTTRGRLIGKVLRMEKTVGGDFEKGLAALKAEAEGAAAPTASE